MSPEADPEEWLACEVVKLAWRARHPATVKLWYAIKDAVLNAIEHPGRTFRAGPILRYVVREHAGITYLLCELPSGNVIPYCEPRAHYRDKEEKDRRDVAITYMGIDATATGGMFGKWQRLYTHPGKFLEQACQSTGLDIMLANAEDIEADGFDVILSVHDELIAETRDFLHGGARLAAHMARGAKFTAGLPLAAGGDVCDWYQKL